MKNKKKINNNNNKIVCVSGTNKQIWIEGKEKNDNFFFNNGKTEKETNAFNVFVVVVVVNLIDPNPESHKLYFFLLSFFSLQISKKENLLLPSLY